MQKIFLILILVVLSGCVTTKIDTSQSTKFTKWIPAEFNENYMRSITKNECKYKAIASLKECDTDRCLRNIAGLSGDCVTYAKGSQKEFCKSYESNFVRPNCSNGSLSEKSCALLKIGKSIYCE